MTTMEEGSAHPRKTEGRTGGPVVGSVRSAIRILNYLAQEAEPKRLRDISRDLALNSSTCLNILRTLASDGIVHFNPAAKLYQPGLGLVGMARTALARDLRVSAARLPLDTLATRHGVSAMLWRRIRENEMLLVVLAVGVNSWRIQADVGTISPLLQGSMGRVMAAHANFDAATFKRRFEQLKWDRRISLADFRGQVDLAEKRGWSVDEGHHNREMISFGVPIIEADGQCISVLTVAKLSGQNEADNSALIEEMRAVAETLKTFPFGP